MGKNRFCFVTLRHIFPENGILSSLSYYIFIDMFSGRQSGAYGQKHRAMEHHIFPDALGVNYYCQRVRIDTNTVDQCFSVTDYTMDSVLYK